MGSLTRAIVVEDDPRMRRIVAKVLTSMGIVVRATSDGAEALSAFNQSHTEPDLICADIRMPNMDGKELARQLRQQGVNVPIIFISGTISKEQEGYRERSHIYLLAKPFSPIHLTEIVKDMLAKPRPEVGPRMPAPPPPAASAAAPGAPARPAQPRPQTAPGAKPRSIIAPSNIPVVPLSPLKGFDSGEFPSQLFPSRDPEPPGDPDRK